MLASAQNAEERTAIYEALVRRNRIVRILRVGLPVLGAVVLAGLVVQLVIGSLLDEFGISGISIDRDNLVVETPSYSSMTADGTQYAVASQGARAALGDTDLLHLDGAELMVTKPSGSWMSAKALQADMRLSSQRVFVPEAMEIADSRGTSGTIIGVHADLTAESMVSEGAASIRYYNGTTLDAASMAYDGKAQTWIFTRVTLTVPPPPTAAPASSEPTTTP
jgi:lipopolysaccharide export system protein LptC